MKIELRAGMKNLEGEFFTDFNPETKKQVPATLRQIIDRALSNDVPNEVLPTDTKMKIYQVQKKLYDGNSCDLTAQEITLVLERSGLTQPPLIFGRLSDILNGDLPMEIPPKEAEDDTTTTTTTVAPVDNQQ